MHTEILSYYVQFSKYINLVCLQTKNLNSSTSLVIMEQIFSFCTHDSFTFFKIQLFLLCLFNLS